MMIEMLLEIVLISINNVKNGTITSMIMTKMLLEIIISIDVIRMMTIIILKVLLEIIKNNFLSFIFK